MRFDFDPLAKLAVFGVAALAAILVMSVVSLGFQVWAPARRVEIWHAIPVAGLFYFALKRYVRL